MTAAAGLGVVALFIAGDIVLPFNDAPSTNAAPIKVAAYVLHHRKALLADVYLNAVSFTLFICFAAGLWQLLRAGVLSGQPFATIGLASAVALSTVLLLGLAIAADVAYRSDTAQLDPQTLRILLDVTFISFAISGLPTIACMAAFSIAITRARALPLWVAWIGFAGAVAHIAGSLTYAHRGAFSLEGSVGQIVPLFFYVWLVAAAVGLLLHARRGGGPGDASEAPTAVQS
ncbi:MAG TPA: hypothetical protein VHE14_07775 [Solirubrobacteraceae bacterium]|nr:hypothetical protein [Solirubrobacteraceae bacterium]